MISSGWCSMKYIKLKKIFKSLESGSREKGGSSSSGIPSLGAQHLDNDGKLKLGDMKFVSLEHYESMNKGKIAKNDILIVKDGATTGKVSFVDSEYLYEKSAINEHVFRITLKEGYLPKYVFWYLFSQKGKSEILKDFRGATVGGISTKFVDKVEIPDLPLEIQKKIVAALDKAQALIDARKEQILLMDELIQSVFYEMFGDPVTNAKGWAVERLKNLSTKILSGNTPKGGRQVYVEDGITFFRSQNVWKNRLELTDVAYIDKDTHAKMKKSSLKNKDILMTKTGRINTENSSLGRAAMFLGEDDSANINGHVYLIRLKKDVIPEFVLFILTTNEYREYIRSVCVGGIDKRQINKNHLEEFPIIMPGIEKQNVFVALWTQGDKLKFEMKKSLDEAQTLFDSLMQKYFE